MKQVSVEGANSPLSEYVKEAKKEDLIVTRKGKPVAALVSITRADLESLKVSSNPRFQAIIERSRKREQAEGGISEEEIRRRLAQ
jgi:prevent-host-death family protein